MSVLSNQARICWQPFVPPEKIYVEYDEAIQWRCVWHEFGDLILIS
jgi:hypothetical protein